MSHLEDELLVKLMVRPEPPLATSSSRLDAPALAIMEPPRLVPTPSKVFLDVSPLLPPKKEEKTSTPYFKLLKKILLVSALLLRVFDVPLLASAA